MDFGTSDVPLTSAEKEKVVSVAVIEWPLPFFFFTCPLFFVCLFGLPFQFLSLSCSFFLFFFPLISPYHHPEVVPAHCTFVTKEKQRKQN